MNKKLPFWSPAKITGITLLFFAAVVFFINSLIGGGSRLFLYCSLCRRFFFSAKQFFPSRNQPRQYR